MGLLYDTAQSYMNKASTAQANATGWMNNANAIAQQGISTASNAASSANSAYDKATSYVSQGVSAAGQMSPYITQVGNTANQVNATAQTLTPYASMLKSYAEQLANNSTPLVDYGTGLLGQADALRNLDGSGGGLIGQYVTNLGQYSPDRYVATAAADAQASASNAWNQLTRSQARTGQNATGSGNQAALQAQWARDTAALLAGAKTRAYQTGLNEQTAALRNALADALTMGNAGVSAVSAGNTALSSASSAASGAANVVAQKGNLEATSGQLAGQAASLQGQQASLYNSAANSTASIASGRISAASLQNSANQQAISAAIAAAQQQGNFASAWANAATSADMMKALGIESGSSGQSTYEKNKASENTKYVSNGGTSGYLPKISSVSSSIA